jgi:signal peptidase II
MASRAHARRARLATFGLGLVVTALDQVIKLVVDAVLPRGGATIGPVFTLQRVSNSGVNFGLFSDHPAPILIVTVAIAVGFVAYVAARPPARWWLVAAFALLLGGAFGNVIDRLRFGAVFDYLNIAPFVGFLNFADLAIGAGLIVLIADSLRTHRPPATQTSVDEDGPAPPG